MFSVDSIGLTWTKLDSLGFFWSHLHSLGLAWSHLDSFWTHLVPLGLTWTHLDSLGLIGIKQITESIRIMEIMRKCCSQGKRKHMVL